MLQNGKNQNGNNKSEIRIMNLTNLNKDETLIKLC